MTDLDPSQYKRVRIVPIHGRGWSVTVSLTAAYRIEHPDTVSGRLDVFHSRDRDECVAVAKELRQRLLAARALMR